MIYEYWNKLCYIPGELVPFFRHGDLRGTWVAFSRKLKRHEMRKWGYRYKRRAE